MYSLQRRTLIETVTIKNPVTNRFINTIKPLGDKNILKRFEVDEINKADGAPGDHSYAVLILYYKMFIRIDILRKDHSIISISISEGSSYVSLPFSGKHYRSKKYVYGNTIDRTLPGIDHTLGYIHCFFAKNGIKLDFSESEEENSFPNYSYEQAWYDYPQPKTSDFKLKPYYSLFEETRRNVRGSRKPVKKEVYAGEVIDDADDYYLLAIQRDALWKAYCYGIDVRTNITDEAPMSALDKAVLKFYALADLTKIKAVRRERLNLITKVVANFFNEESNDNNRPADRSGNQGVGIVRSPAKKIGFKTTLINTPKKAEDPPSPKRIKDRTNNKVQKPYKRNARMASKRLLKKELDEALDFLHYEELLQSIYT